MNTEGNSHFLMAIGRIDGGMPIETADQQLKDVTDAVLRTGKKGTVTVTLEVSPNGDQGIAATVKVTARAPTVNFGQSFFYTDPKGHLTRQAPDMVQQGMFKGSSVNG
jgi:hypothetical protein